VRTAHATNRLYNQYSPSTNKRLKQVVSASRPKDRRGPVTVSDEDVEGYLSQDQLLALRQMEEFGWSLEFIRYPLLDCRTVVVMNKASALVGVLESDGTLRAAPDIVLRHV